MMKNLAPLKISPQKDVLTLVDARQRMANWQNLMSNFYEKGNGNFPRGVFIPLEDLAEIVSLKDKVTSITDADTGQETSINIVGIRAYFTFPLPEEIPINMKAAEYPIDLILVPVYEKEKEHTEPHGKKDKYTDTYDLVAPVPYYDEKRDIVVDKYSVYDITQPCPKLCDQGDTFY